MSFYSGGCFLQNGFRVVAAGVGLWAVPAALLMAARLHAEEKSPFSLEAKTDIYSAYVWRGKALDEHAVAQPCVIGTFNAEDLGLFSLKLWSNWDLSQTWGGGKETRTGGGINVLNLTPSYTKALGPVDLTVGNIFYTFPGDGYPKHCNSTYELYTTVAYRNAVATPSFSAYYDYRGVGGSFLEDNPAKDLYLRAALDKAIRLADRVTAGGTILTGYGTSHYNAVRYHSPEEGFADYETSVFVSYAVTDSLSVGAKLAYTGLIGGAWGLDRDHISPDEIVWGGVNLKWIF